nr:hypothetical protein Iba_chr11bCG7380 [Ipomoea batatas]
MFTFLAQLCGTLLLRSDRSLFPESRFETDEFVVKFESTAISEVGGSPLTEAGKDWKVISPIKVVQWISPGLDSGLDSQMHG